MKSNRYKSIKRGLIITLAALFAICAFVITFSTDENIPDWNDISRRFGVDRDDYIRFIDVGQGDSILITSNGYTALLDTGPSSSAKQLSEELEELGIKTIDVLIISHLHLDHVGGLEQIVQDFAVKKLVLPDLFSQLEGYAAAKQARDSIKNVNGGIYTATEGMNMNIGDFELTVLAYYPDMIIENDRSIVVMAKYEKTKFLLTADCQEGAENRLMLEGIDVDCDVLKLGHHGSRNSSCEEFLDECSPKYAVISVGADNSFKHPSTTVLSRLLKRNCEIYRTDNNGSITFYVTKDGVMPEAEYKN